MKQFNGMKLFVLLFFIICTCIGGTNGSSEISYGDHAENPSVYYDDKQVYELVQQLPGKSQKLINSFYKNDHIINVALDAKKDLQSIFSTNLIPY